MTIKLRARFDGQVLIPDEPAHLPVNQVLNLQVELPAVDNDTAAKLEALERIAARAAEADLPAAALTRESIYEDRS